MATAIYKEGESFYVPQFKVIVRERELPDDMVRDVMQVSYTDSTEEIDSFELVVNNWDAGAGKFKYEPPVKGSYAGIFDPGEKLELWMGYVNNLRLMLSGEITTLEPNYPDSGGSTLSVRGLNVLHSFRRKQHTWSWENVRDSDIAREIGRQPISDQKPGLGVEVKVNDEAAARETAETFVFMNNQYDILFLLERARKHGYSVYLMLDPKDKKKQQIYFGPSNLVRDVTYELEWGKSLVQFRPTLTTARQVQTVTVRGWDRRKHEAIVGTAPKDGKAPTVNADLLASGVARAVQGRQEVITDKPVHTPQEAEKMAEDILRHQLQEMVKASGATVGLPDLRAGSKLHIRKLGPRFEGEYFVTGTTHTIGDSGYRTTFNARREKGL
jgi:uncharacterized protein